MPDSHKANSKDESSAKVDLSELQSLSFGPNWSEQAPDGNYSQGGEGGIEGQRRRRKTSAKQRPGGHKRRQDESQRNQQLKRDRDDTTGDGRIRSKRHVAKGSAKHDRRGAGAAFEPVVEVLFYPQDEPFETLCQAIRRSGKTYELFEIARLILEKPFLEDLFA